LELSQRDFDRTVLRPFGPPGSVSQSVATSERSQHAYLYWMPYNRLSVSAEYEHGRYHSGTSQLFGFSDMSLERVPIEVRYFAPLGVAASLRAAHVRQEGVFSRTPLPGGGATLAPGQDSFWVFDASLGYRLPNRRGIVALNVENLLDEQFRFQDIDPFNPRIMPERLVSLRFTVAFE
jgi:outer membrane receptor protein involved in Fe transport